MRSHYPKFLTQKPLVMGFRVNDLYILALIVLLINLLSNKVLITIGTVLTYSAGVWFYRKTFPRDHLYFYVLGRKKLKWHLALRNVRRE